MDKHLPNDKNNDDRHHEPINIQEGNRPVRSFDFAQGKGNSANRPHQYRHDVPQARHQQQASSSSSSPRPSQSTSILLSASPTSSSTQDKADDTSVDPTQLVRQVEFTAFKFITGVCTLMFLLGKLGFGLFSTVPIVVLCGITYWIFGTEPLGRLRWTFARQETMESLYTSEGETVEWLNYMVEKIWRSIDQDFFDTVEGMVEDAIQAAAPSFIKGIYITGLDIGSQAPRIQMIRMFPPITDESDESVFGEVSFSFHAHPAATLSRKRGQVQSSPPGVSIGASIMSAPPVYVRGELTALKGKVRFKITTGPELPFVSKLTIAFTSPPIIETAVMPVSPHLNIMHIPMLKMMVNEGVRIGMADMVDPKSFTVNIQELMGGDTNDTQALGVAMIEIRGAEADPQLVHVRDLKDSYATLSLSNQPKRSMSVTRVLTNDKDPRWNETLFVLISKDDISADTKVDIRVWDADKVKFDDLWGHYMIPARDIVQCKIDRLGNVTDWCDEERVIHDGWAPIDEKPLNESKMKVNFKLSFHPKYATPRSSVLVKTKAKKEHVLVKPSHTSGILYVNIRRAIDLEISNKDLLEEEELKHPYDPDDVVNPYAVLYINDTKVYQTRSKLRNPSPHWNAVSEHFIKDFDKCTLRISVKTSFDLERDPVLGTKVLTLSELFKDQDNNNNNTGETKEAQAWVPLANGIGFGKVLLTLRYKPVHLSLTRELQGAEVATLIIDSVCLSQLNSPFVQGGHTKATLVLNVDPAIPKSLRARDLQDNAWANKHLYFPLIMRRRTALYIHVAQRGGVVGGTKATGRLWLKETVDDEWQEIQIGLHPYMSEQGKEANRNEDPWDKHGPMGYVTVRLRVKPGFSPVHSHLHMFNKDMVGADPFHNERLTAKAEAWVENQKQEDQQQERRESVSSTISEESGDDESSREDAEDSSEAYVKEMRDEVKVQGISKYPVMRKVAWGTDKVKRRMSTIREGFNSEARVDRAVTKE